MDVASARAGPSHVRDEVACKCQKLFVNFIEEYKENGEFKYIEQAKELRKPERSTIKVSFEHVESFNQHLATTIIEEYYRVYPYLCRAISNVVRDQCNLRTLKECYVSFVDVPTRLKLRKLRSERIGMLMRISGQVIRTHPVHPELTFGTFLCLDCQTINKDIEQQFKFTYPTTCRNPVCNNRSRFMLDIEKSTFVDYQKVKIQEIQQELPRGCIPNALEVILREEDVETLQPGDRFDFTGTFIVVPDIGAMSSSVKLQRNSQLHRRGIYAEGVRGLRTLGIRHLEYSTAFLACSIEPTHPRFGGGADLPPLTASDMTAEAMRSQMCEEEWRKVYDMSQDTNLSNNLIYSLFPHIHGYDEVKRGILLMLLGGVSKHTTEGTTLRGNINCCIVGDPSTGKSQFLKRVGEFWPRSVYTSGKGSSAAGLTAAVVSDVESGDAVIEAGALMLADHGVCCIDEFDKMNARDQVAIHEAMEQQTITIAKAGVRASLNARASILAAANPVDGRYNRARSLQQNVSLTAPIMSRFDLFFVLIDEGSEVADYAIAQKLLNLHNNVDGDSITQVYKDADILQYLNFAKRFQPILTDEAMDLLVNYYMKMRVRNTTSGGSAFHISIRQYESMIRLAEAMAKLQISDEVKAAHVDEAYRLLNASIIRVEQPIIEFEDESWAEWSGSLADKSWNSTGDSLLRGMSNMSVSQKLEISFEEYKRLTNKMIIYMRKEEERLAEQNLPGLRRSELTHWFLFEIARDLQCEGDIHCKRKLFSAVVDRLIKTDGVLIPIIDHGLTGEDKRQQEEDPFLVVHPNYVVQ